MSLWNECLGRGRIVAVFSSLWVSYTWFKMCIIDQGMYSSRPAVQYSNVSQDAIRTPS